MPKIDRSIVSIRFANEELNPSVLSQRLDFTPSEEADKPIMKYRRDKITVWSVCYRESDDVELEKKIETLLGWFTENITIWKEIATKYKGEIFCGLFLDGWNRGFSLSADLLRALSERNLFISFDIYSPTGSWKPES
jgi:hypothetical protein